MGHRRHFRKYPTFNIVRLEMPDSTSGVSGRKAHALGGCDLSVAFIGGEWLWLIRREGRDVAEGAARASLAAKQQAEAVALRLQARFLDVVSRAA